MGKRVTIEDLLPYLATKFLPPVSTSIHRRKSQVHKVLMGVH